MDVALVVTIVGVIAGIIIGIWQIWLSRKQLKQAAPQITTEQVTEGQLLKTIQWNNSGNLFWLPHDLTLTHGLVLRGKSKEEILAGMRQSLHHTRSLGLAKTHGEARPREAAELRRGRQADVAVGERDRQPQHVGGGLDVAPQYFGAAAGVAQQQGREQRDMLALRHLARDECDRLVAVRLEEPGQVGAVRRGERAPTRPGC